MSLDKVKATVLDDVKAKADVMIKTAKQEAERLVADGLSCDNQTKAEAVRDAKLRLERETTRELERIQHENRLHILQAKNAVIDKVFDKVNQQLVSLPETDYVALIGAWLKNLPAGAGGVLRVNPKDEAKFASRLGELNADRSEGDKFTKVTPDPKVVLGALVEGSDFAVNCTIGRKLGEMRDTAAGNLARELFGA